MKFLNDQIGRDLENRKPVKLDLGCGQTPRKGCFSVDHIEMEGVDVVADLNEPLVLLPDNCCDYIYSRHAFEHIDKFLPLMREIHRIIQPGGVVEIVVPHFSNVYGYSDPTHVRFFGLYSMYYFVSSEFQPKIRQVPAFYTDKHFKVKKITIEFYKYSIFDKVFRKIFSILVNSNLSMQNFYERRLCRFFHASQIRYILEPEK